VEPTPDLGEQQNRRALNIIARCMKAKRWPGLLDPRLRA